MWKAFSNNCGKQRGHCRFYNLVNGCRMGDSCKMKHLCPQCDAKGNDAEHPWHVRHFQGRS